MTQSHQVQKQSTHESISTFMKKYNTTGRAHTHKHTHTYQKKSTTMEHTVSQKGQKVSNSPTAAQPNRLYTPGPPLRV